MKQQKILGKQRQVWKVMEGYSLILINCLSISYSFFAFCIQLLTLEGNSILDMFVGMLFLLNNSQVLNIVAKIYPATVTAEFQRILHQVLCTTARQNYWSEGEKIRRDMIYLRLQFRFSFHHFACQHHPFISFQQHP